MLIVGGGEHAARTRQAIDRLGLNDTVQQVGRCQPEEVPHLMRRACALVVPSIYEGMPLVIREAMAAELPVIASRVSGIPEVVRSMGRRRHLGGTFFTVRASHPMDAAPARPRGRPHGAGSVSRHPPFLRRRS